MYNEYKVLRRVFLPIFITRMFENILFLNFFPGLSKLKQIATPCTLIVVVRKQMSMVTSMKPTENKEVLQCFTGVRTGHLAAQGTSWTMAWMQIPTLKPMPLHSPMSLCLIQNSTQKHEFLHSL